MAQRSLPTICLTILTIVVVFAVLREARNVFAPIVAALLLGVVLTPLSDFWDKLRLPSALAAFLSVMLALLTILVLLLLIEPYVTQVINRAPVIWDELRGTIDEFKRILRGLEQMSEDMADAIDTGGDAGEASDDDEPVSIPTLTDALFYAPQFAAQLMIFTGTLYFFLMARNSLYDWAGETFRRLGEEELREAGKQVSRYVLTISAINLSFGVLIVIVMKALGMPSPILWGILAFALNYVLYLGPIVLLGMLTVTGIVMFDGALSFAPPLIYLMMNAIEAQFVTPTMVGRSLSVNPLLIFLSLVFWLWLWGPIGGIIAIPLLVWCITVYKSTVVPQTISSGTAGTLYPTSSAGATE
ncbi:AI-2E family transporter [Loktanella agnita]|uniref:AI-2E family transporter n=1 Tax=Loktanella agnita TaxID=287097 RepID=UPI00398969C6